MKKRILALILALVLACSMSTVALAESKDVTVKVIQEDIHANTIDWEVLYFEYEYTGKDTGSWKDSKTTAKVTVTNDSPNSSLSVSSSMEKKGTINGISVTYTGDGSVETLAPGASKTYTVSINGTPENLSKEVVVGTITVTVS